jgi:hypothetical protein
MRKERGTDWKYARLDDDMVDGTDCYAILSSPSDESREKITGYANRIVYVDKNTYVIRRIEFFNDKNERLKVFDAYDYQGPNGQPQRPRRGVMTNNSKNTTTVMSLLDSKTNAPLAPDMFTLDTIEHWGPDQDHVIQAALPKAAEPTP